ncbi:MAG: hypothetical protein CME71_12395 [Halobacteriovorax sp.]|nr:hypothetical protein [Halobacteriovorax sp.]|tara:strand:- start:46 stop:765 length:720 start_codon:yes stop_codon:yes gene_type:complete
MNDLKLEHIDIYKELVGVSSEEVQQLIKNENFFRCEDVDYQGKQAISAVIDEIVGFGVAEIENELSHKEFPGLESWIGLAPEQLQTPYDELLDLTHELDLCGQESVVDLGAGYGRLGLVLSQQKPDVSFTGYELVGERVERGNQVFNQLAVDNAKLIEQNIIDQDFEIKDSDVYFIYDFGQKEHINQVLKRLDHLANESDFKIVARGRGVRSLIHHKYPRFCRAIEPKHFDTYSVYSTP